MRRVSIIVTCDACEEEIDEETEGSNTLSITVRGEERVLDLCEDCIHGTLWQTARPVTDRKKRKKPADDEFACHCGKSFATLRGLNFHKVRMTHD